MRTLEFVVKKQRLTKQMSCDFSGLVAGSIGYLCAKFHLSNNEWNNCTTKIARFWINDREHAKILDSNNSCDIPPEVLVGDEFAVSVLGAAPNYKIETNKIYVKQGVY
jgi:hypothetical protein